MGKRAAKRGLYLVLREATIVTAKREDFRIVHMSIQQEHIDMVVETDSKAALSNGIRGFSISAAHQINKTITARGLRRTGRVFADRYHARPLTGPRAVRNALAYGLANWRRHGEDRAPFARTWRVDPWPLPPTYHPLIVGSPPGLVSGETRRIAA